MIKITIDNEEVVSDKNFTIEEEMLNTPSVILNNVYPKSWETSKDYTTNFYHPNDYSKCLITDETDNPGEPGSNVSGSAFNINVDTSKEYSFKLTGQTTQDSTPTPTTPVPVNVVSGRQDIVVAGKNLLPNNTTTQTINGITYTVNSDKSITLSGTSSAVSDLYFVGTSSQYVDLGLATGNYNLNGVIGGSGTTYMLYCVQNRNGTLYYYQSTTDSGLNISVQSGDRFRFFIRVANGKTVNTTIYPMLEKGNQATSYEAYNGNTYEINLGKNLAKIFEGTSTYTSGTTTYTITGTTNKLIVSNNLQSGDDNTGFNINIATGTTQRWAYTTANILSQPSQSLANESGTYTISLKVNGGTFSGTATGSFRITVGIVDTSTDTARVQEIVAGGLTGNIDVDRSLTFTINTNEYIKCIGLYSQNIILDNQEVQVQLEKGSSASSYAEYKTPIELCKIGNYQDRIYKNGNKWYLEKNIGKYIFTGSSSENWQYYSVSQGSLFRCNNVITDDKNVNTIVPYSNYYQGIPYSQQGYRANGQFYLGMDTTVDFLNNDITTVADWRTWLGTHNTSIYYVQATPTTTEITDTELISQLNVIRLLNGINNVSITSLYTPMIMDLHYNYITPGVNVNLLFCGVVKNSGNISLNPRDPHYQTLQILDFKTFLSEGETLDFVIANKTIEEAIDQIISTIAPYGFVKGNIQIIGANTIIGAYSTKDKTAYDVFNYLADITQSRWTTRLIDENTVAIDFYDPTLLPQGTPINYTASWFRDNLIDDMSYSYGSNDYRNKQVMSSNEVYGNILQTQTIVANGYQTQFDTELKIGQITSITANGTQLTIATNEQKELGFNADIYYTPGNNYFESADLRSTGEILIVNYIAIVEGRQIITNGTEINRVATATGRKGIVARYENRNDATTSNELQLIGQSYIKYKGVPEIKLTITSRSNLWNIGDRVQFNAPINELDTEYMVKKKTINRILANPSSEEHIVYTFELTSSFNSEQAINYFDNQRAKAKGNIGAGEYITRNVDIESNANIIFYDNSIEEVSVDGDNVLNSILNSPFNN